MKRAKLMCSTAALAVLAGPAAAQLAPNTRPSGGQVTAGQASIGGSASTTLIRQSSENAAINWQSYNVGSAQSVQYVQPNATAITLNRVVGPDPSEIAGKIKANGQIIIVNQSGVVFDRGSQVDTAGLVVSAAGITNKNFLAGHMVFDQAAHAGAVVSNAGNITVRQAGLAALVAPQVANSGTITARMGRVILGGAVTHTLDLYGDGLVALNVTGEVTQASLGGKPVAALVTNAGTILAPGGTVVLSAVAADGVVTNLVSAGGKIAAPTVGTQAGRVLVQGIGGGITLDGQISATGVAAGTKGGQVVANATGAVNVAAGAVVDASGDAGGGVVAVGTTAARAIGGASVKPALVAQSVSIAPGAQIRANATRRGKGGRIAVLSRDGTRQAGAIAARGGAQGGDGGWIEVSGGKVEFGGTMDVRAAQGAPGSILIDPADLDIGVLPTGTPAGTTLITAREFGDFSGNVILTATGTLTVNQAVATATGSFAAVTLQLEGDKGIFIDAPVNAGLIPVALYSPLGSITEGRFGALVGGITAASLSAKAQGPLTLSNLNTVSTLGTFSNNPQFSDTGTVVVSVSNGTVTGHQPGVADQIALTDGLLTIGTLTGGGVTNGTITLDNVGPLTVSAPVAAVNGGFTLTNSGGLLVQAPVSASGGDIVVTSAGAMSVQSPVTAAGGNVDISVSGTSAGNNLRPGAAPDPLKVAADMTGQNVTLSVTGSVANYADASFVQSAGTILAAGSGSTGGQIAISVTTGAISLGGTMLTTAPRAPTVPAGGVTLAALAGDMTEPNGGSIQTGTLSGAAGGSGNQDTPPIGNVNFAIAGNTISTLGAFSAAGTFALQDDTGFAVAGIVSAGSSVALSTGAGNMTEAPAGSIRAASLSGTAGLTGSGNATLSNSSTASLGNTISTLTAFQTRGDFVLEDDAGLTVAAITAGGSISVTGPLGGGTPGGALLITGAVAAPQSVALGNSVGVAVLSGASVTSTLGGVTLASAGGAVGVQEGATLSGGASASSFTTAIDLFAGGNTRFAGPAAALGIVHGIEIGGTLSAGLAAGVYAGNVNLAAANGDVLEASSGQILANSLSGSATGTGTPGLAASGDADFSLNAGNSLGAIGSFSATGNFALAQNNGLTITGPLSAAGSISVSLASALGGNLVVAGSVLGTGTTAGASNVFLQSGAGITESTGAEVGSVAGDVALTTPGAITQATLSSLVGRDASGTALSLSAGSVGFAGTLVAGSLTAGGYAGALSITAGAGDVQEQTGGVVRAGSISGSAFGSADFAVGAGNTIGTLGAFATGGDFALEDDTALLITGAVTAGTPASQAYSGNVFLKTVSGDMTEQGAGAILANTLAGGSGGNADLGGSANTLAAVGDFAAGGNFTLKDATGFDLSGTLSAGSLSHGTYGGAVALTALANDISEQAGGHLYAGTLSGSASGSADFGMTGANTISTLGEFSTGGSFSLADEVGLAVAGVLTVGTHSGGTYSGEATLTLSTGSLTETGIGIIQAGALSASAPAGSVGLTATSSAGSGNQVGTLVAGTALGQFDLVDGQALAVSGLLQAGTGISLATPALYISGGLFLTGTGTVSLVADSFSIGGGGVAIQGGIVALDLLTSSSGNTIFSVGSGAGSTVTPAGLALINTGGGTLALGSLDGAAASPGGAGPGGWAFGSGGTVSALDLNARLSFSAATVGTLGLFSNGAINASSGLTVTALYGAAGGPNALNGTATIGGAGNSIASLGTFATQQSGSAGNAPAFLLSDNSALLVSGPVTAGQGAVDIAVGAASAPPQNLTATGTISGNSVFLKATGSILQSSGAINDPLSGTVSMISASGGVTFAGSVSGASVLLSAGGGNVFQSGGSIAATTLAARASGDISIGQVANSILAIGPVTSSAVDPRSSVATSLSLYGLNAAGQAGITLQDASQLQIADDTVAGGVTHETVLASGGPVSIALTVGGITLGTATGATVQAQDGIVLNAPGAVVQNGGAVTAQGGDIAVTSAQASVMQNGGVFSAPAGNVFVTANGDITQSQAGISAAQDIILRAGGSIGQTNSFIQAGGSVSGTATGDLNGVGVAQTSSTIGAGETVQLASTGGGFFQVSAPGSASSVAGTHGVTLDFYGPVSSTGGGTIASAGVAGDATSGTVVVASSHGSIGFDGVIAGGGSFTAASFGGPLPVFVPGASSAVLLSAKGGDIAEASTGQVDAGILAAGASGNITLSAAGNQISAIGSLSSSQPSLVLDGLSAGGSAGISLADSAALTILADTAGTPVVQATSAGATLRIAETGSTRLSFDFVEYSPLSIGTAGVSTLEAGGSIALTSSGTIIQGPGVVRSAAGSLSVQSFEGGISQAGGTLLAASGSVGLAAIGSVSQTLGSVIQAGGGNVSISAGNGLNPQNLFFQGGNITQDGSFIIATGNVVLTAAALGANGGLGHIAQFDSSTISAGGSAALTSAQGSFTQTASSLLGTQGVSLAFLGDIVQTQGLVEAVNGPLGVTTSGGTISQSGGTLLAAAGGVTLLAGGSVTQTLGSVIQAGAGDVAISAGGNITQDGSVISATGNAALTAAANGPNGGLGMIVQTNGSTLSAGGTATLISTQGGFTQTASSVLGTLGVAVAFLGDVTGTNGVIMSGMASGAPVTTGTVSITSLAGSISSGGTAGLIASDPFGGTVLLSAPHGDIVADQVIAGTLAAAAGGNIDLTGANSITGVAAVGTFTGLSAGSGTIAFNDQNTLGVGPGTAITAPGGSITMVLGGLDLTRATVLASGDITVSTNYAGPIGQAGGLIQSGNGTVSLSANSFSQSSGATIAAGGDVDIGADSNASFTGSTIRADNNVSIAVGLASPDGGSFIQGNGLADSIYGGNTVSIAANGSFVPFGGEYGGSFSQAAGASIVGGRAVNLSSDSDLALAGTVQAGTLAAGGFTGSLSLYSENGAIAAPMATLLAGTLTAQAYGGGIQASSGANQIAQTGTLFALSDIVLQDSQSLVVAGPVTAYNAYSFEGNGGGNVSLTVAGGSLTDVVGSPVTATGSLALTASGAVSVGGSLSGNTVAISGGGAVAEFSGASITGTEGVNIISRDALSVGGVVASFGPISLGAGTALDVAAGGSMTAGGAGTLSAPGPITIEGALAVDGTLGIFGNSFSEAAGGSITAGPTEIAAALGPMRVGGVLAVNGKLALSAGTGFSETQGGSITAGATTVSTGGTAAFDGVVAGSTLDLSAQFAVSQGAQGTLTALGRATLTTFGTISLAGTLSAPGIVLGGPSTQAIVWDDNTIITGANAGVHGATKTFSIPAPLKGGLGVFADASAFQQIGTSSVRPDGGTAATMQVTIAGRGTAQFDSLLASSTQLLLVLEHGGTAGGAIDVAGLNVYYTTGVTPSAPVALRGSVGGDGGFGAAAVSFSHHVANVNYQINACPIESINCILLSPLVVPVVDPVNDYAEGTQRKRHHDEDALPNVGAEDY